MIGWLLEPGHVICDLADDVVITGKGTLGLVTGAWLQLVPLPESVQTLLAGFPVLEAATAAVPRLLRAGLLQQQEQRLARRLVLPFLEVLQYQLLRQRQLLCLLG